MNARVGACVESGREEFPEGRRRCARRKTSFQPRPSRPQTGKARRIASLSAAAAMVVGIGAASAIFVDYLADRALARPRMPAPVAVKPVVAKAAEAAAETKVAALAPAVASGQPVEPPKAEIAAATPDPAAVAKVPPRSAPSMRSSCRPTILPRARSCSSTRFARGCVPPSTRMFRTRSRSRRMRTEEPGRRNRRPAAIVAYAPEEPAGEEQPIKKPKRQKAAEGQAAAEPRPRLRRCPASMSAAWPANLPTTTMPTARSARHEADEEPGRRGRRLRARHCGGQTALGPDEGFGGADGRAGGFGGERAFLRRLVPGRLQRQQGLGVQELPGRFEVPE